MYEIRFIDENNQDKIVDRNKRTLEFLKPKTTINVAKFVLIDKGMIF